MMSTDGLRDRLLADCSTDVNDGQWNSSQQTAEQPEPLTSNSLSNASTPRTEALPPLSQKTNELPGFWTLTSSNLYPRLSTEPIDGETTDQSSWMSAIQDFPPSDGTLTSTAPSDGTLTSTAPSDGTLTSGAHVYPEPYSKLISQDPKYRDYRQKDQGTTEHPIAKVPKAQANFPPETDESNMWAETQPTSTSNFYPTPQWAPQSNMASARKSYTELTNKQTTYKNLPTFPMEPPKILNLDNQKEGIYPYAGSGYQPGYFGAKQYSVPEPPTWHTPQLPHLYTPYSMEHKHYANYFKAPSTTRRKWPCCYGARQNLEYPNSSRIQKSCMRSTPSALTSGARDTKQRVSWSSSIPLERSAEKLPCSGSPEPRNYRLRTYEADSTSNQLPDNSSTGSTSIQKPADSYLPSNSLVGTTEQPNPRDFPNQGTRYGYIRKPSEINTKYTYSMPLVSPAGSQIPVDQGPSTSIEAKRFNNFNQTPYESQSFPTMGGHAGDVTAERHPWISSDRMVTPWISNAALEEKRRRNREASARCEEKRKWKTEQLKKDNQYAREAAVKLFEENQRLWEQLEQLKKRTGPESASGRNASETDIN